MLASPDFFYFDLGKVLLDFSHEQGFRQMAAVADVPYDTVASYFLEQDRQLAYEAGQISTEELFEGFAAATNARSGREELLFAAGDIFTPIPATVELLHELRAAELRLGLLSNTCDAHWRVCTDGRYPFLHEALETIVLSFEVQAAKPESRIYEHAAELCGVPPEQTFFVDDRPENVAGARDYGFDAVLFQNADQLRKDLRERGVDIAKR